MAKKNSVVLKSMRISAEMNEILVEVAEELCIKKVDIVRLLLNRALMQLKYDSLRAGGYKNLDFAIKKIK